ncbi:MAG: phosphoribosylformylglycinamidine synthase subunit PurQ [Paracoccaceae bacterium]
MKVGVLVFPGSNCDRDIAVAFERIGATVTMVWHKQTSLPDQLDVIAIPGGFSFGDYLRCGAIAARSPISKALVDFAHRGGYVLGICNGFQILTETGLLPGALMQNAKLKFLGKSTDLIVSTTESAFTHRYVQGQSISIPIAHHEGNYSANPETLKTLIDNDRIAFRYKDNPNGASEDIAGILSENRRVLGMMPHPERAVDAALGGVDGQPFFAGLTDVLVSA